VRGGVYKAILLEFLGYVSIEILLTIHVVSLLIEWNLYSGLNIKTTSST
jgi:hypothetical protein